jgi:uncharacterized membrane protein YdjX (TVP38/TMEM64 family)
MNSGWLHEAVHWMTEIQSAGWMGWLLFIVLYAGSCLVFMPGSILTLGAGAIYGFWEGVALVLVGNGLGAFLSLVLTRYLLKDWAAKHFARSKRLLALQSAVEKEGWKIVCLTHLSPVMPFSLINYAYGLTNISIIEFLLATEIGSIPSTFIYVYLGTFLGNLAKIGPEIRQHGALEWVLQGMGVVATIAVTIYISRVTSQILNKRFPRHEPAS